ncbi:MAG: transaldolase [Gammaproteobacteria bacterium]|nr:transaldolase [Gammaproteobacteria bacterium]TVQ45690.1 MAG: transaldolase [Gammaproteobacteria bacterium]
MHPRLSELASHGQSIWLDTIDRTLLERGGLAEYITQGVTGVTTNPSIFHKAITAGGEYDASIRAWLAANPAGETPALLDALMVEDVTRAADLLREVYEYRGGEDGYVSLEVSPLLAHDTEATIAAARRLFDAVDRPNVMIKIPATPEGLKAIEATLADGINVNVTLLFAVSRYLEVLRAWRQGVARLAAPGSVASVASFFVSRIDTLVDRALEELGSEDALALRGQVAIANARVAWDEFSAFMAAPEMADLRGRGARGQRLLWGSTGTKNDAYSDVLYVDQLIGRDTVNTLPPATLEAFLDHGTVSDTLAGRAAAAGEILGRVERMGISMAAVTAQLEREGVEAFADAYRKLLAALDERRAALQAA